MFDIWARIAIAAFPKSILKRVYGITKDYVRRDWFTENTRTTNAAVFQFAKIEYRSETFQRYLVKKPTAKMNSIAFTQNDIVLQLQLQSKPWKCLHTITDKTQVSFRQFAWGDFHTHLLASLTLFIHEKKITVRLPGEKIYHFII